MFSFIKNFTDYSPKSFKGKTPKEILAMKSSNVPADFFTDAYTQAHLQEFADADLSEEQENAIDLLSDLKDKPEIIRKCYDKRKKRTQKQQEKQAPIQAEAQTDESGDEESMQGPMQAPAEQAPAQPAQAPIEQGPIEQGPIEQAPAEGNATPQNERPLIGGGRRRKQTKKAKLSKKGKSKRKRSKKGKKPSKKSKRVRFSI